MQKKVVCFEKAQYNVEAFYCGKKSRLSLNVLFRNFFLIFSCIFASFCAILIFQPYVRILRYFFINFLCFVLKNIYLAITWAQSEDDGQAETRRCCCEFFFKNLKTKEQYHTRGIYSYLAQNAPIYVEFY